MCHPIALPLTFNLPAENNPHTFPTPRHTSGTAAAFSNTHHCHHCSCFVPSPRPSPSTCLPHNVTLPHTSPRLRTCCSLLKHTTYFPRPRSLPSTHPQTCPTPLPHFRDYRELFEEESSDEEGDPNGQGGLSNGADLNFEPGGLDFDHDPEAGAGGRKGAAGGGGRGFSNRSLNSNSDLNSGSVEPVGAPGRVSRKGSGRQSGSGRRGEWETKRLLQVRV